MDKPPNGKLLVRSVHSFAVHTESAEEESSIGSVIASMTSQNGGQDLSISLGLTSDDPVTRSVSPRKVS